MSANSAFSHGKQLARRGVFALAVTAAVATAGIGPAAAQDGPGHTVACMKYGNSPKRLQCEYDASVARTKGKNAEAAAADARGAAADKLAGCYDYLTKGIKAGKIDSAGVRSKVAGRPLRDVACKIAAEYGYSV